MKHKLKSVAFGAALLAALGGAGCGSDDNSGPLGNIQSLVILQRAARNDVNDIFSYQSYNASTPARLVKLSPPTADGQLTTLCCDKAGSEFAAVDISGYDISFDATQIVFSAKLSDSTAYGLYLLNLADNSVTEIPTDPSRDYVSPIWLPGGRIMFTTNSVVKNMAVNPTTQAAIDPNPAQHEDEYERGTTTQMGSINADGTDEQLGPRNLSHRTQPSLASDGRVIFTNWDHLGPENAGHLMFMNTDMTELREAFGKEGTSPSNSTLKAQEIAPGRFVGIATARNRTVNAGALLDIRLGYPSTLDNGDVVANTAMSEAHATYVNMTPDVPMDNTPSADTIGRYYDAYPLDAKDKPSLLVSWADGPVETSILAAAGQTANFGIYLYDSSTLERHPILDDPNMWDVYARPLQARTAPAVTSSAVDQTLGGQALIGAMNVYDSTLHSFTPGSIYGVRVMEGFSSEEGFPRMFGTTMFEGHANLATARVATDGSWLATVPANVPLHLQTVDVFGMSLFNEPVWFSARAGESRVCGGCHEDRAASTVINPGITQAAAIGPTDAKGLVPRDQRLSSLTDLADPAATPDKLVGMAWDKALQPVFDAKCVSCHGDDNKAGIAPYTISDAMGNVVLTWTFNLSSTPFTFPYSDDPGTGETPQTFSSSYFTMAGPDMEAITMNALMISGNFKVYMNPEDAVDSLVIQKVNPTQLFPAPSATRAFATSPHSADTGNYGGAGELTSAEFYKLILAADMGVNYYARENNPNPSY